MNKQQKWKQQQQQQQKPEALPQPKNEQTSDWLLSIS